MPDEPSQSLRSNRISESSIARMAGNIAAGLIDKNVAAYDADPDRIIAVAIVSVRIARAIAGEVERTAAGKDAQ